VQHVLDAHSADDRAKVTREQLVNGGLHHGRVLVQEPARCIGDAGQVVTDLVGDDTLDGQRDGLVGHGVDHEAGGAQVQAETADGLEAGDDGGPAADDDLEAKAVQLGVVLALGPQPGDDQASFGSATRHTRRKRPMMRMTATSANPTR